MFPKPKPNFTAAEVDTAEAKPFSAWEDVATGASNIGEKWYGQGEEKISTPKHKDAIPFNRQVPNFVLPHEPDSAPGIFHRINRVP